MARVKKREIVPHPDDQPVEKGLTIPQRMDELAEALANPMDLRQAEELSEDFRIPLPEIRKLQADPRWMGPVTAKFKRALGGAELLIFKKILRQVDEGNMAAARLALQSLSGDLGNGIKVNVLNVGGKPVEDEISKLSDEELNREIVRLWEQTNPDDLEMHGEEVFPVGGYVEVVEDDEEAGD